jgi:hypothetical protein
MRHQLVFCALAVCIVGSTAASAAEGFTCPVTLVNDGKGGHYQNEALKVGLWPNGKVTFRPNGPGQMAEDGSLAMKFWWWRLKPGALKIEGRRLDADAPPLRARIPDGYPRGFQSTALIFPTVGCWEVTGHLGEEQLTFVTLVERVEEPARAVKR